MPTLRSEACVVASWGPELSVADRLYIRTLRFLSKIGRVRVASKLLAGLFPGSSVIELQTGGGPAFCRLRDPYWSRLIVGWEHEVEVREFLDQVANEQPDAVLIDGGANIGYWSARYFESFSKVVAVEAVPPTFSFTERAAQSSGFLALQKALWVSAGERVDVSWHSVNDPGASVMERLDGDTNSNYASIETVSIENILSGLSVPQTQFVVVKLDVEGAEIEAVKGAAGRFDQILFVFEDHGKDRDHRVSTWFMKAGFLVCALREGEAPMVLKSRADLERAKPSNSYGYNFVAIHPEGLWAHSGTSTGIVPPTSSRTPRSSRS